VNQQHYAGSTPGFPSGKDLIITSTQTVRPAHDLFSHPLAQQPAGHNEHQDQQPRGSRAKLFREPGAPEKTANPED
jgi:hypothetical protein